MLDQAAVAEVTVTRTDDSNPLSPAEQAAELERLRRLLETASPEDFGAG